MNQNERLIRYFLDMLKHADLGTQVSGLGYMADQLERLKVVPIPGPYRYDFQDNMEKLLFEHKCQQDSTVMDHTPPAFPFWFLYETYGRLLLKNRQYAEARKILRIALRWDPFNAYTYFLYSCAAWEEKDREAARQAAVQILSVAYWSHHLAKAYLMLGNYYLYRQDYKAAYACFYMRRQYYRKNKDLAARMAAFPKKHPECAVLDSKEKVSQVLAEHEIPYTKVLENAQLALQKAEACYKEGKLMEAQYFYFVVYCLTHDKKYWKLRNEIQAKRRNPFG